MAWRAKDKQAKPRGEYRKPEWARLYNNEQWREASKAYRLANPLCVECERHGVTKAAECVDHIEPHRGDYQRFWNRHNWQSLCNECHARKTRSEDR